MPLRLLWAAFVTRSVFVETSKTDSSTAFCWSKQYFIDTVSLTHYDLYIHTIFLGLDGKH